MLYLPNKENTIVLITIIQGKVECSLQAPDDPSSTPIVAATLSEHDYFGEISLLTHEPRRATVTAATQVRLLSMMRTHFLQVHTLPLLCASFFVPPNTLFVNRS